MVASVDFHFESLKTRMASIRGATCSKSSRSLRVVRYSAGKSLSAANSFALSGRKAYVHVLPLVLRIASASSHRP